MQRSAPLVSSKDVYYHLLWMEKEKSEKWTKTIADDVVRTDSNELFLQVDDETLARRANPLFNLLYAYAMYDDVINYN